MTTPGGLNTGSWPQDDIHNNGQEDILICIAGDTPGVLQANGAQE